MSEPKHTPGPWIYSTTKYDDWGTIRRYPCEESEIGIPVANASLAGISEDEIRLARKEKYDPVAANAHLIATAPELLEALENLLEAVLAHARTGAVIPPSMMKTIGGAAQALSKAKGGAS